MATIPVPSVNTPTYQTWGAAVAAALNEVYVYGNRRAVTSDAFGDFAVALPAGMGTVLAAFAAPFLDGNLIVLHRNANLTWRVRFVSGTLATNYGMTVDLIIVGTRA